MTRIYLTVAEVEAIHFRVLQHSGGLAGVRDRGALEAAVFRPQCGYYADVIEEAAALLESLTQNHPFQDGNKRTAFVATLTFLEANGLKCIVADKAAEDFMLQSLEKSTFRFPAIRDWLVSVVKPL